MVFAKFSALNTRIRGLWEHFKKTRSYQGYFLKYPPLLIFVAKQGGFISKSLTISHILASEIVAKQGGFISGGYFKKYPWWSRQTTHSDPDER